MCSFEKNGIRRIGFDLQKSSIRELKSHWKEHARNIEPYPQNFEGRGIVMCAGGLSYYTCCWVAIKAIRRLGCNLPIQVWYLGNELSDEVKIELEKLDVECQNFFNHGTTSLSGWMLKPLSIVKSSFKEILFIDADNVCVKNPEELFLTKEYLEYGAIFWPDYWQTSIENPIWDIIGSKDFDTKEQESGQILINKEKCWKELNLCLYFNDMSEIYYKLLFGDKDTFKFAWLALKKPFHMIKTEVGTCGYIDSHNNFLGTTMVQHNTKGEFCFLHRNLLKWDITQPGERVWKKIKRFLPDAAVKEYHFSHSDTNGYFYMDLKGDVEEIDFDGALGDYEEICLNFLEELRSSQLYHRFVTYSHFAVHRYPKHTTFTIVN
jgi:alpha 1,2-mannosyltransferase